jgi:hypothetical protein
MPTLKFFAIFSLPVLVWGGSGGLDLNPLLCDDVVSVLPLAEPEVVFKIFKRIGPKTRCYKRFFSVQFTLFVFN